MSTKNKEVKEITDIDLDTGTNLVTENYQLEILGLKDLVDLRKFSRSFLKVDKLLKSIFTGKEDKIDKKSAFNKEFGVAQNEVLEGSKLAEILGIEYGGVLNNNNQKIAGKGYYDTANKKIYKCTTNTSINYADAGYFIEVSNNDLLGKLQNLSNSNNLVRFPNGDGMLFVNKSSGIGNTINFNAIFSEVYQCIVSPWLSGDNPYVTIPLFHKISGGKIYINSLTFSKSTSTWQHRISEYEDLNQSYASARCIVFGKLIR